MYKKKKKNDSYECYDKKYIGMLYYYYENRLLLYYLLSTKNNKCK